MYFINLILCSLKGIIVHIKVDVEERVKDVEKHVEDHMKLM